jgi:hypothetical protein
MTLKELLTPLGNLDRADKIRAMQFLVSEIAKEEEALMDTSATYPMWTPYDSFGAAKTLLQALKEDQSTPYA